MDCLSLELILNFIVKYIRITDLNREERVSLFKHHLEKL